jgi:tetratricopeptide (TPR) repeat protein
MGYCLIFTRHFDEAIALFEDLLELFPESRYAEIMRMEMGWAYGGKGMYEEAVAIYNQLGDSTYCYWSPGGNWQVSRDFARSSHRQDMVDALAVAQERYEEFQTGRWAWLTAFAHTALDQHPQAMEWLARSGVEFQKDIEAGNPEAKQWVFRQARLYAWLGEKDLALQWLEQAYELRAPKVVMLNHMFEFDSIRDDPRFQDILERIWG